MRRAVFDRKLKAAEAYVSHAYAVASVGAFLTDLYERASDTDDMLHPLVLSHYQEEMSELLSRTTKAHEGSLGSVALFFEVGPESNSDGGQVKNMLSLQSELVNLKIDLDVAIEMHGKYEDSEMSEVAWEEVMRAWGSVQSKLADYSAVMRAVNEDQMRIIRSMRSEMSRIQS